MNALLGVFASAVLPVVAIAAAGFLLGRTRDVEPGPLNTVTVYVLAPALVFHSLATSTLAAGTLARVAVGVVAFTLAMAAVAEGVGRLRGTEEPLLSALLLVAVFSNSGNLGIPVSDFAFGETGRSTAVLFLSVQAVLMYTVGVYVASRSGGASGFDGVKRVVRLPLVYAVAGALLARGAGVTPPADAASMEAVGLVGDSAIPVMLIVLGLQLARTDYAAAVSKAGTGAALKLLVAPAVGLAVAHLVGFSDPTVARVFVLETAMPAAITPVILVAEFAGNRDLGGVTVPEYVSTVVLVTTLLSIPLLTVLIVALQTGLLV